MTSDDTLSLTIVPSVIVKFLVVQVDDICTHIVKETLVMGNYEESLLPALKVAAGGKEQSRTTNESHY